MIIWLLLVRAMTSVKSQRRITSDGAVGLFVMGLIEVFTVDFAIYYILLEMVK
ncbi:hypothetical protein VPHD148_0109 [Vibrio phage D148]